MVIWRRLAFLSPCLLAAALAVACTETSKSSTSSGGPPPGELDDDGGTKDVGPNEEASAYVVAGTIVGTNGEPLPDVEVYADNQLVEGSTLVAYTDSAGRYRLELPETATTWAMSATHTVEYHGTSYSFPLHPENDRVFAGNTGAIRNFSWKLTGTRPDDSNYGAFVVGYTEPAEFGFELSDVELTLEPDGPLVDGSNGKAITKKLERTPEGDAIDDVPLGRYTISAKLPSGPLVVRIRNGGGDYASSITADFDAPYGSLPIYQIDVEMKQP